MSRGGGWDEGLPLVVTKMAAAKNKDAGMIARTTSCITDPQVSALDALKEPNLRLLSDLLLSEEEDIRVDVNKSYPEEKHKTLLHLASERGEAEAVRLLVSSGADSNISNRALHTTPLHASALKGHVDVVRILLASKANVNAVTAEGRTVVHILAQKWAEHSGDDRFRTCLEMCLAQNGVEIDKKDSSGGHTPLHLATGPLPSSLPVVRLLLSRGADWSVKTDEDEGVSSREEIKSKISRKQFQALIELSDSVPINPPSLSSAIRNDLMRILNEAELAFDKADEENNFEEFLASLLLAATADLESGNPGELSLIQRAADIGLTKHVQALLSKGADPNWAASGTAPALVLAAKSGHVGVIRVLKEHKINKEDDPMTKTCDFSVIDKNSKSSVLHSVLRKPFGDLAMPATTGLQLETEETPEDRYTACLKAILEEVSPSMDREIRRVVNALDEMGNTPLHYATQMWPQTVVRMLLERGANIGMKNAYNEVPVENILPETMEAFLDEFCLTSEGDLTNKDFRVTARYDFLAPPRDFDDQLNEARDARKEGWKKNGVGVDGDAAEKQKPDKGGGDTNQTTKFPPLPETEVLWYMSQSKKHRHLLKHPVITSFLWLKWKRISSSYNKNLAFYISFVICLTSYIFVIYGGKSLRSVSVLGEACTGNATVDDAFVATLPKEVNVLWHINTVLLVLLGLRELLQFGIAPRRYFFSLENWLEDTLIVLISLLLFMGGYGCYVDAKRHVAAVVIVLSWSVLITMIGRHPKLSTYNLYVTMFYKVLSTFIMFLIWYSLFIFAFAMGFYILLHRDDGREVGDDDYLFFNTLGLCIVKTFTMFVGELEFGDLPIETPVGYLFFLAFVFLIVVVMMNLLNGLAVENTGIILEQAEINYYVCQVEVISYIESMLLGDPFNLLSNWPAFIWLRRLPTCSLGKSLYSTPPLRAFFHRLSGASGLLLFYERLPEKKIAFYPNHDAPFCGCMRGEGEEEPDFPPNILDAAKAVILAKSRDCVDVGERLAETEALLREVVRENGKMAAKLDLILRRLK